MAPDAPSPETYPSGSRLGPPRLPPAPPDSSGWSGDAPDSGFGDALARLEEGLNDLSIIRTAFQTLDLFPEDAALQHELLPLMQSAQHQLTARLQRLAAWSNEVRIQSAEAIGPYFRRSMLHMIRKEDRPERLDAILAHYLGTPFERSDKPAAQRQGGLGFRYVLRREPKAGIENLSAAALLTCLLEDLLDAVRDPASYQNLFAFDAAVFQKYLVLTYFTATGVTWPFTAPEE